MTSFAERRRSRKGACRPRARFLGVEVLWVRAAALLGFATVLLAQPVSAQTTLAEAEARYESAVAEHQANVETRDRAFNLHEQALDRVDAARSDRNDAQLQQAQAESRERALELMDLERTVSQSAARVESARAAYQDALESREEEILGELDPGTGTALPAQQEQALITEWRQLRTRVLDLEAQAASDQPPALRPVPDVTIDPRDSRDDLVFKENLMEDRAASYDSLIADLRNEVAELERQQSRNQSLQDLLRDVQRSGPDLVPGAPLLPPAVSQGDGDAGNDDGTGAEELAADSRPIEERIELLRDTIQRAEQFRDQASAMAGVFRSLAEALGR